MYFHQWSDITRRAKVFFFLSLRRHSAVSFRSEVQQIAISPPLFFPRFPYLPSLSTPLLLAFQRSKPPPLSPLSDTRVDDTFRFSNRRVRDTRGNARSQWAIKTEQIRNPYFS